MVRERLYVRRSDGTYITPYGLNTTLTKLSASHYELRDNASGVTQTFQHVDAGGELHTSRLTDLNGNQVTYTYPTPTSFTASSMTDTQGRQFTFTYDDGDRVPSLVTDVSGGRRVAITRSGYCCDASTTGWTIIDAAGKITTLAATGTNGQIVTITDPDNRQTRVTFDNVPGVRRVSTYTSNPIGPITSTWTFTSNADFSQTYVDDPRTGDTTYQLYPTGEVEKVIDPLGHERDASFNPDGRPLSRTNALSASTSYTWSTNNALDSIQAPGGRTTSFDYPTTITGGPADYRPTQATDAQGNTTTFTYTPGNLNLTAVASPGGVAGTVENFYQGQSGVPSCGGRPGQLCRTEDGKNQSTTFAYDAAGNLTTMTPPAPLAATTYTYDGAGRPLTITTGAGTATHTWDALDRLTQISYTGTTCTTSAGTCVKYTYDNGGHLLTRIDKTGTTTFTYDQQARPKTKVFGGDTATAGYDASGNLTSYTDVNGTLTYGYDAANRLVTLAEPGGSCPTTPVFPNSTKCTGYSYDDADRRTQTRYPNGQTIDYGYDTSDRALSINAKNAGGTTLASRSYTYLDGTTDTALRQTATDETGATTTYTYDPVNRLTAAALAGTTTTWTYDANGNRLSEQVGAAAATNYSYNAADQLCWLKQSGTGTCTTPPSGATTFGYDNRGNQTTSSAGVTAAAYSVWNQQTSTTVAGYPQTYSYADIDATERTTAGPTTFLNGMAGVTRTTNGSTVVRYHRDPYGNLVSAVAAGATHYYTTDAQGSTILTTNNGGYLTARYRYDPWGKITHIEGSYATANPWRYQGGHHDTQTGYTKFGTRYYNPTTGRWIQPDPVYGEQRYAFAGSDPVNTQDPTGYFSVKLGWITGTIYLNRSETNRLAANTWTVAAGCAAMPGPARLACVFGPPRLAAAASNARAEGECLYIRFYLGNPVVNWTGNHSGGRC